MTELGCSTEIADRQVALEFGTDPADRASMQMIECGLHSGFPKCCVVFFVKVWWPYMIAIDQLSPRARADALIPFDAYLKWTTRPGYVPCSKCIVERSFVEVLACDCEARRLRAAAKTRRGR